jgi:predicted ABC-type ATPase
MPIYPQLLFVAGPNGAGKSTFSKKLSDRSAVIFDVYKVIARIEAQSPGMLKKQVYQAATQEFFNLATEATRKKQHFTLETNFRDESLLDIVANFKRLDYTTNMVYLVLKNIKESVSRVNQRVKNGGHYVDHKNIEQNYDLGLQYLERFADRFDNLEIVDASGNDFQLRSMLSIYQQQLVYLSTDLPTGVAETIKRIASRYNSRGLDGDEERGRTGRPRR